MNNDDIIKELKEENNRLKEELQITKEHLKKYTAPASRKLYYENNKEQILEKMKANPTPPDKRKEYNRESYLRRKEKQKANNENI
jgi:hypothetical protein